jgi:plastocyanin
VETIIRAGVGTIRVSASGRVAFAVNAAEFTNVFRLLLPGLLGAALLAASSGPSPRVPPRRATGRIQGVVEISTALSARRPQFRIYAEPGSGATPPPAPRDLMAAELRNVVVYLETAGATPTEAGRARMAQRDERFLPHVLPVVKGTVVDFPNDDDVYHNVFSLSEAAGKNGFDLGRYPKGASKSWTFDRAGTVQVFCHIHSDMSAVVLVLGNPFFASPDESRHYAIDGVPEGEYTIVGWHERIKPVTRRIRVTAGQTTTLDFNIPLPQGGARSP